jgi:gluconokinase
MHHIIGIDIGTTNAKAVLTTADGKLLFEIKKSYPSYQPKPGYHEQKPEQILAAVTAILKKTAEKIPQNQREIVVCFSAAMHSLLAVDENGNALTAMFTWADMRSNTYAAELKKTIIGQTIYSQTGVPVHPMLPLCKIAWIKDQAPAVFGKAAKFVSGKEYVLFHLLGEWVIDYAIASATGLFDTGKKEWSADALTYCGITGQQLSTPVLPYFQLTSLRKSFQLDLGLPDTTTFIVGSSDGCMANIGSGAVSFEEAALTIGTSGAIRQLSPQQIIDPLQRLFNYRMDDEIFLTGGAINNGGILLKWFVEIFTDNTDSFEVTIARWLDKAKEIPAGCDGLLFLPYVYGERAPVWDADAKGIFIGISPIHTKAHFLRAILEGVAFSLLQIMKAMEDNNKPLHTLYASGGFLESSLWLRIITDVLQKKISVSHTADASAMGAVYTAMYAMGYIKNWNQVKPLVFTDEEITPNNAAYTVYERQFNIFTQLYEKHKANFSLLKDSAMK